MKYNGKLLTVLFCFLILSVAFSVTAQAVFAAENEEVITGTVVETDEGIIIEADDGDYLVEGADLSAVVGKVVEVTGVISETDEGEVIQVTSYEEVEE